MGSCLSSPHKKISNSSIPTSLHPSEWNEKDIILWLQQSSNLSLLIKTFKKHKISGLTFVNLNQNELQNELHINEFGLVKEFILLRDKLLSDYNLNKTDTSFHSSTTHSSHKIPNTPPSTVHNMPINLLNQIQNSNSNSNNNGEIIENLRETSPLLTETITHTNNTNQTQLFSAVITQNETEIITNQTYLDEYHENISDEDCYMETLVPPVILTGRTNKTNCSITNRNRMLFASNHGWKVELMQQNVQQKDKKLSVDMITVNDLKWKPIYENNINSLDVLGIVNNECIHKVYDYTFMRQYNNISYIGGSKLVINGCIHALSLLCKNNNYNIICKLSELTYKYYFEPEKHVFQFGYDVWKILYKINRMECVNNIKYKAFIGSDLVIETRKKYWNKYRFGNTICYCCDLLKYKCIQLIGIKQGAEKPNDNCKYLNDTQYLYHFLKWKKREFKKFHYFNANMLDRESWNIGTAVEIFSSTLNGWVFGEIIKISIDNNIVVSYSGSGFNSKYLLKTVNKNNKNLIRSTRNYICTRNKWTIGTEIEIFSHSDMKWCKGIIESIIAKDTKNNVIDTLRIKYKKFSDGLYYTKRINFWSCDLRNIQIIKDKKLLKYKLNKQCQIYENDKNIWVTNNIKHILPMHKYVIVENPKTKIERIIDINSKLIRLLNE